MGIGGNEAADRLAKEALGHAEPRGAKVPHPDLKYKIKTQVRNEWRQSWSRNTKNKLREIKTDLGPRQNEKLNRRDEVKLTQLQIGHNALTHRFLLEGGEKPQCEICDCDLTVKHILIECQRFDRVRSRHYQVRDLKSHFQISRSTTNFKFRKNAHTNF